MISSVSIKNFQKHKNLELDFVPGINVITGKTDTGKSSIIRALRWVLENRPSGAKFKTKKTAPSTSVNVDVIIDNETITRTRSSSKNEYFFRGEAYKAMGSDVPEPIAEFTNISPLNIQRQLDDHFLFQYPDSKVSKMINDVSGMEEVILALEETNRRVRKAKSDEEFICELIDEKEKDIRKLSKFDDIADEVSIIRKRITKMEKKELKLERIRKILISTKKIKEEKLHKNIFNKVIKNYNNVIEISYQLAPKIEYVERLKKSIDRYRLLSNEPKIKFGPIDSKVKRIKEIKSLLLKKEDSLFKLESFIKSYKTLDSKSSEISEELKELTSSLSKLKKKLKICPMCRKEW